MYFLSDKWSGLGTVATLIDAIIRRMYDIAINESNIGEKSNQHNNILIMDGTGIRICLICKGQN
jgi:hypothetical protein